MGEFGLHLFIQVGPLGWCEPFIRPTVHLGFLASIVGMQVPGDRFNLFADVMPGLR